MTFFDVYLRVRYDHVKDDGLFACGIFSVNWFGHLFNPSFKARVNLLYRDKFIFRITCFVDEFISFWLESFQYLRSLPWTWTQTSILKMRQNMIPKFQLKVNSIQRSSSKIHSKHMLRTWSCHKWTWGLLVFHVLSKIKSIKRCFELGKSYTLRFGAFKTFFDRLLACTNQKNLKFLKNQLIK